jgi:hypothetical protein
VQVHPKLNSKAVLFAVGVHGLLGLFIIKKLRSIFLKATCMLLFVYIFSTVLDGFRHYKVFSKFDGNLTFFLTRPYKKYESLIEPQIGQSKYSHPQNFASFAYNSRSLCTSRAPSKEAHHTPPHYARVQKALFQP